MGLYSAPKQEKKSAEKKKYAPLDYSSVDVYSMVEQHTPIRLSRGSKSRNGRCPYPGCTSTHDSFIVYADIEQTNKHIHYWCRKCDRSGDLIQLLRDINNWSFVEAKEHIGLAKPGAATHFVKQERKESEWEKNQKKLLESLRIYYDTYRMQNALQVYERPRAYLLERGITLEQAIKYGLGYIPFESEIGKPYNDYLLKMWSGRIIFPLTGKGAGMTFAGRTLAFWKRGMSPDEHKKLLEENSIIRTLKTSPCGYYGYAEAIAGDAEHIVPCEGEFDALSLQIAGVEHVVATGQYPHANDFPISLMWVTIALDADNSGQKAMHKLSVEFEAAGLSVRTVIPQGGKDWNDMLRTGNIANILPLFQAACPVPNTQKPAPKIVVEYDLCGSCLDEGKDSKAIHYHDEIGYCKSHYLALGLLQESLTQERFHSVAHKLAAIIPGGCEVHMDPPGYTIEDRVRELAEEKNEKYERLGMIECSSPDEFFERLERGRLKNFIANVPSKFLERAKRPRTYPAPFPEYGLVVNPETGKEELKQVGIHSATIEAPAMTA